jgi:hypothetical protein
MPKAIANKPSRHSKVFWVSLALLLTCAASFAAAAIWRYENNKAAVTDRVRFEQAAVDIDNVTADVVLAAGKPLKASDYKNCSQPNTEVVKAMLTCRAVSDIFYSLDSPAEANNIYKTASTALQRSWDLSNTTTSNNLNGFKQFGSFSDNSSQQIFEEYSDPKIIIDCKVTYLFYETTHLPGNDYRLDSAKPYVLNISTSCSDFAKAEHFMGAN